MVPPVTLFTDMVLHPLAHVGTPQTGEPPGVTRQAKLIVEVTATDGVNVIVLKPVPLAAVNGVQPLISIPIGQVLPLREYHR